MFDLEEIKARRMTGIIVAIICIFAVVCQVESREAIDDEVLAVYQAYPATQLPPTTMPEPAPTLVPMIQATPAVPVTHMAPGAILRFADPWTGAMSDFDTGICPRLAGHGWTGSLAWPVTGRGIEPGRGFRLGHSAIDILAPIGAPVYAAETGIVIWAGYSTWGYGELVTLGHGGEWETYYAHLTEAFVSCGQAVARGTLIGMIGQTGMSGFPHLHFSVGRGNWVYDPLTWMTGSTPGPTRNPPAPPPGGNAGL